jgi:hypothetical protein
MLALLGYALAHQWLLVSLILAALGVVVIIFVARDRRRPRSGLTILSSPRVEDVHDTLTALSAIGLDVLDSEPALPGATELDRVRVVELRLRRDFETCFQQLASASGGLLTKADQVTLQVALLDRELSAADMLPLLNSQLDPAKGQFFYVSEDDDRVVFLTPEQVQALSARGWRF